MAIKVSTAYLLKVKGHPKQTIVCLDRDTLKQQMGLLRRAWPGKQINYETHVAYQLTQD